jgi:hypothetical protein
MTTHRLSIHNGGGWVTEINGLTDEELAEAVDMITDAKVRSARSPNAYYEITTRAGQTTRIFGSSILGFDHYPQ